LEKAADVSAFGLLLEQSGARGMIIYAPPAHLIGQALQADHPLEEVVDAWHEVAQAHLKIMRKWRQKLLILQAPVTSADHQALIDLLQKAFPKATLPQMQNWVSTPDTDQTYPALAMLELGQNQAVLKTLHDMQARSQSPFTEMPTQRAVIGQLLTQTQTHRQNRRVQNSKTAAMEQQITDLETALKAEHKTLQQEKLAQKAQATQFADHIRKSEHERAALHQQITDLEKTQTETWAQNTDLKQNNAELEKAAQRAAAQAHDTQVAHTAEINKLTQKIKSAQQQTQALTRQIETDQAKARTQVQTQTQKLEAAQQAVQQEKQISTLLGGQINELEDAMRALFETAEQARSQNSLLKTESDQIRKVLKQTVSEFNQMDGDRKWKSQISAVFRQKTQHLEAAIEQIEQSRVQAAQTAQLQIDELIADNQALRAHIDDLYQSTSWRMTAPMRSIRHLLQK
jgi:hypothetical protein